MRYTAFISYSHAADGRLAEAVQRALHRFANPWYKRRSLTVFRDKTSLAANPALWPAIESALAQSDWFIYMASPRGAQSPWVRKEIQWWLDHRPHERLLMILTDGDLVWNPVAGDFDWTQTTAVAADLRGTFKDEPLYVDLRWTRSRDDLSLRHSQFRSAILDVAAPLHGKPKEDLDGEDVRQHRRNKTWAWSAIAALLVLFATAAAAAVYARTQRNEALRQRDEAISRLYSQQMARIDSLAGTDPALALQALDDTVRAAGERREFTWDLYERLASRVVFAVGGMRNWRGNAKDSVVPVFDITGDGRRLAIASTRRAKRDDLSDRAVTSEILIWDAVTGAQLHTLPLVDSRKGLAPTVESVVFSPDGRHVAAGAGLVDSIVKVWEVESGREVLKAEAPFVRFLRFTGSGLVAVSDYGESRFWRSLQPNVAGASVATSAVGAVAMGAEADQIVLATPKAIERLNLRTGQRTSTPNPAGITFTLAVSPGGSWIAQASGDAIHVWRTDAAGPPRVFERGHREWVSALAFSSDGRLLASGGNDHSVRVWDVERGVPILMLRGPMGAITTLRFSTDGTRLVAGAVDATVFVWDIAGSPIRPAHRVESRISTSCTGFSADKPSLLTGGGWNVVVRPAATGAQETIVAGTGDASTCGQSRDGSTVFVVDRDQRLMLVEPATGAVRAHTGRLGDVGEIRVNDRGDLVAAKIGTRTLHAYDGKTGADLGAIDAGGTLEGVFDVWPEGEVVAQVAENGGSWIGLWNARSGARLASVPVPKLTHQAMFGVCSPRRLVASSDVDGMRLVDLGARRIAWQLASMPDDVSAFNQVTAIEFSADCTAMAVGDKVGRISVWEVATGKQRYRVPAHSGLQVFGGTSLSNADGVNGLAFSRDGRTLASGGGTASGRGELKLWDAARGLLLATLPADSGTVRRVTFADDGRSLGVLLRRTRQDSRHAATILEIWDTRGFERALLAGLSEPVERLTFSPDGVRLTAEDRSNVISWNLSSGAVEQRKARTKSPDVASGATPRVPWGQTSVFAQQHLLMVDGREGPRRLEPPAGGDYYHSLPVQQLRAFRDGRVLSLASGSVLEKPAEILLWDIAAGRPIREAFEPSNIVAALEVSPDERTFVTAGALSRVGEPGFVHVWDVERFVRIASLTGHRANVTAVAFSADGKTLATGDASGFVRVWDIRR